MSRASRVPEQLAARPWGVPGDFLGLEPEPRSWEEARAVILPVPYEATTSWGTGTREGPAAILEASRYLELYDEELDAEPHGCGIHTLPPLELTRSSPREAVVQLREVYDELLDVAGDKFVVTLGGEHTISSAPALAWHRRLGEELSVLQLDAHTDLRESHDGTPWSHACVMRRVLDRMPSIVPVGIRSLTAGERELVREQGMEVVFAEEMRSEGWVEKALSALRDRVYVTFDVDFFDPSLVPATGTPEPGGGDWWQALDLLRAVFRERNVVGADVVELAPGPGQRASATVAAKLVYKMIGYREHL